MPLLFSIFIERIYRKEEKKYERFVFKYLKLDNPRIETDAFFLINSSINLERQILRGR